MICAGAAVVDRDVLLSGVVGAATVEGVREPLPNIKVKGVIRPPGAALIDREFRSRCISCGVCVNVCHVMKYNAIAMVGLSNIRGLGTPYIKYMRDFPCTLCMECTKHCPTGALEEVSREDANMGMALIDLSLCFGWNGDVCLSCSKACPMGAKVFDFYYSVWGNQPMINEHCVGCGLCVRYCVLGGSAIKVVRPEQYEEIKADYRAEFMRVLKLNHLDRYKMVYEKNLPLIMERHWITEREFRKRE